MNELASIWQNNLALQLAPISMRELFILNSLPCDLYVFYQGKLSLVREQNTGLDRQLFKEFIRRGMIKLFVKTKVYQLVINEHQKLLINNTRALSIGDKYENISKQLNLLAINMHHLYQNNTNDELLNIQVKATKNLTAVLKDRIKMVPQLFADFTRQKHYYLYAQPLVSSFLLLAFLDFLKLFDDKDQESLFLASYFKDIGMSTIPSDQYDKKFFSLEDKKIFDGHTQQSRLLLSSKHIISPSYLKIIENHHILQKPQLLPEEKYLLTGIETMLVSAMDIIAAMISDRPYRSATNLYDALERTRILVAKQYPQEFKLLILFFQRFFQQLNS